MRILTEIIFWVVLGLSSETLGEGKCCGEFLGVWMADRELAQFYKGKGRGEGNLKFQMALLVSCEFARPMKHRKSRVALRLRK
jgi:hypothetical protein